MEYHMDHGANKSESIATTFTRAVPYTEMHETIPALVHDVHASARRIERIVSDLKDYARPGARGGSAAFDLNDAVQRGIRLLTHLIQRNTTYFRLDLAAALPPV
jgi:signal transduction histidine kinase